MKNVLILLVTFGWLGQIAAAQQPIACPVPQTQTARAWTAVSADSEELIGESGQPRRNAVDGNPGTMWHTQWLNASPPPPHEIVIDLGAAYPVSYVGYLPRQDGCSNGWIAQYEIYAMTSLTTLDAPVATGLLAYSVPTGCPGAGVPGEQKIGFPVKTARYIKLRALTEITGGPYTSAAEIRVYQSSVPLQITTESLPLGVKGFPYPYQPGPSTGPVIKAQSAPTTTVSGPGFTTNPATVAGPVSEGTTPKHLAIGPPAAETPASAPPSTTPIRPSRMRPLIPAGPPQILGVSPASGSVGSTVTIQGENFAPSGCMVSFGKKTGLGGPDIDIRVGTRPPSFLDQARLTAIVPKLTPGPHDVYLDCYGGRDFHGKIVRAFTVTGSK